MIQIHPYVEGREIHRGRRFSVLRALGPDGAVRVLKTVRPGARAASSAAILRHEQAVLEALELPGVGRSLGLLELELAPALVLVDAGPHNLREWLRRKPLGIGAFLASARELAEIVACLHARRIIHGDLDAANVVVGEDGRLTLVDFGLATSVAGAQGSAVASDFSGALGAIAPEQTGRVNRPVDHRADLYSLGATFYEMLTGRPPFSSRDPAELVHAHLAREPVAPADVGREVPRLLSDLVLRLLAKMPEHRYQSAAALVADLAEAERRFRGGGVIAGFELGLVDLERELAVPARLYGRERELAQLEAAVDRVAAGAGELVLLVGAAGAGKSALVRALSEAAPQRARYRFCKFDLLRGNVPYGPLIEAIPELTALLDAPDGAQAERPSPLSLQAFVQALATASRPLVLFLDDLQWADAASLRLLRALAVPESHHLLLVGAYRAEDLAAEHPLEATLRAAREAGIPTRVLRLAALDLDALTSFCADTLRCDAGRARPLAATVLRKTAGNPFFVQRFLRHLHRSGLLAFDAERGAWDWDPRRIAEAGLTENVVELMVTAIRRLPEGTQRALTIAACLPGRIELALLAAVAGATEDETAKQLWSALQEGLLVPVVAPLAEPFAAEVQGAPSAAYRFVHDRVQQAARSLLDAEEQRRLHLAAGRRLLEGAEQEVEARLFEAVDQLHRGAALLEGEERLRVAALSLRAARKARASSAFTQALDYASRGLALLAPDAWASEHALWLSLSREAAQGAYLTSDFSRARALIDATLPRATTRFEQLDLDVLRVVAATVAQDHAEAIRSAREGLARFGLALPEGAAAAEVARGELAAVEAILEARAGDDLLASPAMRDPDALGCMQLLSSLTAPAWRSVDQGLFAFVVTRMVALSLRLGMAPESGGALVRFGLIRGVARGDFASGHALSRLGVDLARRHGDARHECRALFGFAFHMSHWKGPLRSTIALYRRAAEMGLEQGELEYSVFAREHTSTNLLAMGAELDEVLADLEGALALARKLDHQMTVDTLRLRRHAVRCLQGGARGPALEDDELEAARLVEAARRTRPEIACRHEILALTRCYLFGDLEGALTMSDAASAHLEALTGTVEIADHNVYTSLTLAARCDGRSGEDRSLLLAAVEENQRLLGRWAEGCPENYRHKHALVAAEVARVLGRPLDEVLAGYEQAIEGALREGFLQDEALALELAGRCLHARGHRLTASHHLRAAARAYARWGATAKVDALAEELGGLVAAPNDPALEVAGGANIDVLSLLKAAETLSSEVVLERLLEKLMAVCLEAAGAQRGALVLDEAGALTVRAVGAVSVPVVLERTPLGAARRLPRSIIEEVFRTGEPIVLADAGRRGRFTADPDVRARGVRSALAVPIRKQARVSGVIYLENDLATRAFTADRARVLELLSSGIGIALENSLLFKAAQEALRFSEDFVSVASHELNTPITSLQLAVQALTRGGPRSPETMTRALQTVERQGWRLAALVGEMLDVSRIRAGRLELDLGPVDLAGVARDAAESLAAQLALARCATSVRADGPVVGRWDRDRLAQVVTNLLTNALKYGKGRPIEITVDARGGAARLVVTDHGIGIEPALLDRVFARFERGVSAKHYGGLGLGLYIVHEIVSALGGRILVESEVGAGSTFTVELPCAGPPSAA